MAESQKFLQYHEPDIVQILIIISFFFFLSLAEWISAKVIRAGIIGQIAVGIIYGRPLADIIPQTWQETFLALGYVGLILIIFEGGLTARLDLLKQNFMLSMLAATTGVVMPISLSYLLLYLGFGYGAVETFIIGAALSATSLGTTFAVMSSSSKEVDLSQTRVGSVLVSAAVIDDVTGLVMSSVISQLGGNTSNIGWVIGRPILASALMAILTPLIATYILAPLFRRYIEQYFHRFDHASNIFLMALVLCGFISIAAYAGTSVLFGAFLAGTVISYLPSTHPEGPFVVLSREEGEQRKDKSPTFVHTFELYLLDVQQYLMAPLFFASIGFAVPFLSLWSGGTVWRGIVYSLLMAFSKFIVGAWVFVWTSVEGTRRKREDVLNDSGPLRWGALFAPAALLGFAMVARGEIGLLIVQIGYNDTEYVSDSGFFTAVWAILLNTIIGPVMVGTLVKLRGRQIGEGAWGIQRANDEKNEENGDVRGAA